MPSTGSIMIALACNADLNTPLKQIARKITLEEAQALYEKYGD